MNTGLANGGICFARGVGVVWRCLIILGGVGRGGNRWWGLMYVFEVCVFLLLLTMEAGQGEGKRSSNDEG